jgi:hypothetical protein
MEAADPWCPRARRKPARGGAWLSIETGPRARGVGPAPERSRAPLEGASDPRVRRSCIGAALYPSSGAEFRSRVAGPIGP